MSRGSSRDRGRRCWDRAAATTFPPGARRRGAPRGRSPIGLLRPSSATAMPVKPTVLAGKLLMSTANLTPSTSTRPRDSRERARDREREEVAAPDRDPAVAGRLGIEAHRAHLEPECRPVEDDVVDEEPEKRDEDAGMKRLDRVAPEHPQLEPTPARPPTAEESATAASGAGPRARTGTCPRRSRSS